MVWAGPFGLFLMQLKILDSNKLFGADQSWTPCCFSVATSIQRNLLCLYPSSLLNPEYSHIADILSLFFCNSRPFLVCYIFLSLISFCLNYQDALVTLPMSHVYPLGHQWDLNIFPLNSKEICSHSYSGGRKEFLYRNVSEAFIHDKIYLPLHLCGARLEKIGHYCNIGLWWWLHCVICEVCN